MAFHRVDSDAISGLVTELQNITSFVDELIADIQGVAERVSAEWTGDANAQYRELHAQWSDGAAKMADGATKITTRASISAQNYSDVADHVKGIWS